MGLTFRAAVAVSLAFALATGCGATPITSSSATGPTSSASATAAAADAPVRVSYPRLGIAAPLAPTGLDAHGAVAVPALDRAAEVDYLNWSPHLRPGRPTVLISHVNGRNLAGQVIPGGFVNLAKAQRGDLITVDTAAGVEATYRVTSVATVKKATFPASTYDPTPRPELVLITCGGTLNRAAHSFDSNVIVRAELT